MRKMMYLLTVLLLSMVGMTTTYAGSPEQPKIVYLDLDGCEVCDAVKDYGVLTALEAQGVEVIIYDVMKEPLISDQYAFAYGIDGGRAAPIIFAGDVYFRGEQDIIQAFEDGRIFENAQNPLRSLEGYEPREFTFIGGLLFVIIAGLLDGINPCAIAMLLMFITLIGVTKHRKVMVIVTTSYILSILLTYLIIGFGFLTILGLSRSAFGDISFYLYGFFFLLTLFLAILTLYDFFVTKKDDYSKVKNQLPKFIQGFNKRLMEKLTETMDSQKRFKYLWFILIPAFIGVLVGITEAACTGQIYIAVLASLEANNPGGGIGAVEIIYLVVFNIMFVVPLMIIATIAIITRNTISIANFVRKHLFVIKFATAVFFLVMAVYFLLLALGYSLFSFEFNI